MGVGLVPSSERKRIQKSLVDTYATLRGVGGTLMSHLVTDRVDVCSYGNTLGSAYQPAWLSRHLATTQAALDAEAGGRPEGLVVRAADRAAIAKIRYEDYERHAKRSRSRT